MGKEWAKKLYSMWKMRPYKKVVIYNSRRFGLVFVGYQRGEVAIFYTFIFPSKITFSLPRGCMYTPLQWIILSYELIMYDPIANLDLWYLKKLQAVEQLQIKFAHVKSYVRLHELAIFSNLYKFPEWSCDKSILY